MGLHMLRHVSTLALILLSLATTRIEASPLTYDEAVSGDLASGLVTVLSLGAGSNTVAGRMHFFVYPDASPNPTFDWDADPVDLRLPTGLHITSISIVTSFRENIGNLAEFDWEWYLSAAGSQWKTCYAFLKPTSTCSTHAPQGGPLFDGFVSDASSYLLSFGASLKPNNFALDAGGWFDYRMTVTVGAVPEPSTIHLLLVALVPALVFRTRRRAANTRPFA
jgi:hypothetical protein